ncbi:MAG: deoxyhypusine synthase family protein, partial [Candidatus Heimdallarchaeota archaeon]|nr:deoxyhypusine synthase family protein [Candidatus Heimdallarchaeota archaeon]MCK5144793.1 deoxyhypusine synthase family protein [Candidatus Heimdallarchaeota archaeon]
DLGEIQRSAWDSDLAGAFFLGGGVPKNYIFQSRLMSPKTFDYAIQITMDRVETGGLSGASLSEAISWGKVDQKSRMTTVVSDVTIALPLIYSATLARIKKSD